MMKNKIIFLLALLWMISVNTSAQSIQDILKTIEKNNLEIQAGQKFLNSKEQEYKHNVLPEGPEFSYGYFPDNSNNPGPKETFQISQSFQMPFFYRNQSKYSKLLVEKEQVNQNLLRQEILFRAKSLLIEYIYYTKMELELEKRLEHAENLFEAYQQKLESGDGNVLEMNKSKLHLLHLKNQRKRNVSESNRIKEQLVYLNGKQELDLDISTYKISNNYSVDSVLQDRLTNGQKITFSKIQSNSSEQLLKVTKNKQLPEFSVGYGGETVADEKFRGLIVGVSIPLWGSASAIKSARYQSEYMQLNHQLMIKQVQTEVNVQVEKVESLANSLNDFKETLSQVNNIELLKKAKSLGEISMIEYFMEISYFYQVYDDFLMIEKEYYLALAELFRYRL
ncbi:MAG TPA: TolC family protein [Bacteroidales bacterium]|nr:TolC family protein [Bacteroidales bacterium]